MGDNSDVFDVDHFVDGQRRSSNRADRSRGQGKRRGIGRGGRWISSTLNNWDDDEDLPDPERTPSSTIFNEESSVMAGHDDGREDVPLDGLDNDMDDGGSIFDETETRRNRTQIGEKLEVILMVFLCI